MSRPKLRYAHQGGHNPPVVVVHGSGVAKVSDDYKRYLENAFRDAFKLKGTRCAWNCVRAANPFEGQNRRPHCQSGTAKRRDKIRSKRLFGSNGLWALKNRTAPDANCWSMAGGAKSLFGELSAFRLEFTSGDVIFGRSVRPIRSVFANPRIKQLENKNMSGKGQLLQDPFLNTLRKEHIPSRSTWSTASNCRARSNRSTSTSCC